MRGLRVCELLQALDALAAGEAFRYRAERHVRVGVLVLVAHSYNSERFRTANVASAAPPIADPLTVGDDTSYGSRAEKVVNFDRADRSSVLSLVVHTVPLGTSTFRAPTRLDTVLRRQGRVIGPARLDDAIREDQELSHGGRDDDHRAFPTSLEAAGE